MSRRNQLPGRSRRRHAALLSMVCASMTVGVVALLSACSKETCFWTGPFDRCEGNTYVHCPGGLSYPVVRREDCGAQAMVCLAMQPGDPETSARCETLCDPATYATQCDGGAAYNCSSFPNLDGGVIRQDDCTEWPKASCLMRSDAGGLEAYCHPLPPDDDVPDGGAQDAGARDAGARNAGVRDGGARDGG